MRESAETRNSLSDGQIKVRESAEERERERDCEKILD